jgi:hypothetical protein
MLIITFSFYFCLLFLSEFYSFVVHYKCTGQLKSRLKYTTNPFSQQPKNVSIVSLINPQDDRGMVILPRTGFEDLLRISEERDKLLSERADLLLRLAELTSQSVHYLASIAKKDIEIEELRRENAELKKRISLLETQVSQQASEILQLQTENLQQASEILQLQTENLQQVSEISHLQAYVSQQRIKTEFEVFITALQDSNAIYQLEQQSPSMYDLRELQNSLSHYIKYRDSAELVNYKISMLIKKLQTDMSVACRSRFQRNFGETFVNDVVQLLSSNLGNGNVSISSVEKKRADGWWDEELV